MTDTEQTPAPPADSVSVEQASLEKRLELRKLAAEAALAETRLARERRSHMHELSSGYDDRTFVFTGVVDEWTAQRGLLCLAEWRRQSDEPVTFIFNSPGGQVMPGLALYDAIRMAVDDGLAVTTAGLGRAASMGGVLLQAGSDRAMSPNAHLLIHEVSAGAIGTGSEIRDTSEHVEQLWVRLSDILAERATMSGADIREKASRRDWWLTAQQALMYGFIDRIGKP